LDALHASAYVIKKKCLFICCLNRVFFSVTDGHHSQEDVLAGFKF